MPSNLFADIHTDVGLRILDQRVKVQAQRFAGMDQATGGADQKRFDRLVATLVALVGEIRERGAGPGSSP